MTEPQSFTFHSQRLSLQCIDWGNPDAPPLILVHGGRDHARAWDDVARALAKDFHVVAPDLRGHGDSQWADAGGYTMPGFILDLVKLIDHLGSPQVRLVGHSLGGNIALRTAGLYPDRVSRLVSIEGLGPSPRVAQEMAAKPIETRMHGWVDEQRRLAARPVHRYASLEEAFARMQSQNPHLNAEQAMHLTRHGVRQTEAGDFVWKFDPYVRSWPPVDFSRDEIRHLWGRISCPVLLVYGSASWASNPETDGRSAHFANASVATIEGAGHWVHHDRLNNFLERVRPWLGG